MLSTKTLPRTLLCAGLALVTTACIARGPDDYRKVTRSVVDTKNAEIEACFGGAEGKAVIDFTVAKKTGTIQGATATDASTASPEVSACIVKAIEGLAIEDGDMRDGAASFTWTFSS